jgi:hypothetical protein
MKQIEYMAEETLEAVETGRVKHVVNRVELQDLGEVI